MMLEGDDDTTTRRRRQIEERRGSNSTKRLKLNQLAEMVASLEEPLSVFAACEQ